MAKIHPILPSSSSSSSSSPSKSESFTIWMKSLVMQSNGCTVYNQDGQVVYRVDNYDSKGSSEVFLMDLHGAVLFTIKKPWLAKEWKGFKSEGLVKSKPYFQVRKSWKLLKGDLCCKIVVRSDNQRYKLEASEGKSAFKITDSNGEIVAKATRKQTREGIVLGDDVISMEIKGEVDKSFIMALVTVYGLMLNRL